MNTQDFKNKYLGTFQREPGIATGECVWCAKLYAHDVLGITLAPFGGSARNGWLNLTNTFDPKYWVKNPNTPKGVPTQGNIVFFNFGINGHVAIVDSADKNVLNVIEQNGAGGFGDKPGDEIRLHTYDYSKCLGWFSVIIPQAIGGGAPASIIEEIGNPTYTLPTLPPNPYKTVANYNQTINGECGFFASYGMITYNTGKIFKNLFIHNVASPNCDGGAFPPIGAMRVVAKEQGKTGYVLKEADAEIVMNNGYSTSITIIAPTEMIIDGIRDGKIDGTYNPDVTKSHEIMLIKEGTKYFLINSLGKYATGTTYNKYEISYTQLKAIMRGTNYYFIY